MTLWTLLTHLLGTLGEILSGVVPLSLNIVALALALKTHPERETWAFRIAQALVIVLCTLAAFDSISWLIGAVGSATLDYRRHR